MLALIKTHPIFNFSRPLVCRRQKYQKGNGNTQSGSDVQGPKLVTDIYNIPDS